MSPTAAPIRIPALLVLLAVFRPTSLPAQEHAHDATHGLGRVTFVVSCSAEARHRFAHAVAVLHSFWWEEAPGAFNAVLAADSTCAMAYWGLALTAWNNPFAGGPAPASAALASGATAARHAAALGGKTPREAGFIAATGALYRDAATTSNATRLQAYADTMARLYQDQGGDDEVAIYYALALVATMPRTDTTFADARRAAAILNPLFVRHPDHPGLAHYIIHASDTPRLATLGLDAARRYARIAPAAPHAQHMPSHIFIRLGLWDETIASNQAAADAGIRYAQAMHLSGIPYEQFHAFDYMVYALLQEGRDAAARRVVTTAYAFPEAPVPTVIGSYNRTAMEARLALERGDWAAAAQLPVHGDSMALVTMALSRFARALGAARSGQVGPARLEERVLDSLVTLLASRHEPYWSRVVGIKAEAASAWVAFAAGDTSGAIAAASAAADREDVTEKHQITPGELLPARELAGDLFLAAGRFAEARSAYQATLGREPGRARSLYGAARAAELAGDRAAALTGYRAFVAAMARADSSHPALVAARRFLAETSPATQ